MDDIWSANSNVGSLMDMGIVPLDDAFRFKWVVKRYVELIFLVTLEVVLHVVSVDHTRKRIGIASSCIIKDIMKKKRHHA